MWPIALLVVPAFALGTFPTAMLVARAQGHDILREGSGNPGASNVLRVLGTRWFVLVMGVDAAKGAVAAGVGMAVGGRAGALTLGIAAVVGHTFPVWRKGGKGVATAAGMLVVLYPVVALAGAVVWAVIALALRKASLASLTVIVLFPVATWALGYDAVEVAVLAAIAAVLVIRHAANIGRLVRGNEADLRGPPGEERPRPA